MNAIFFDVDGTLFDTRADLAATVNHTRRDLGLGALPVETVIQSVGQGARYLMAHAIPESEKPFEELWTIFKSHYEEHCCENLVPYPGVRETLSELKASGWLLGINTSKPNFAVQRILKRFEMTDFFGEAVIAGGDCAELKPSALPLRECAARLNGHILTPEDWMVGDSWTDLQCAANAGIKSAFCTFGFGCLKDASFTVRIDRFSDLLNLPKP